MPARRKNFHVPLSDDVYMRLKGEAERTGKPATELAREAIEAALSERRRAELYQSIASYAAVAAGTNDDIDRELERATVQYLLKSKGRRR
jgi:predicted DNA-binding protein